ncbi:hypothetical protein J5N97_014711 [Dioscorea zingiberensis]|uniref:Sororin C-terminal region domain-containing protein n=1 Tax=Dioscorea zingiberensis TaxID=325984 RepID=A0A9D5CUG7_9LILI|nr:hypothetical protein J5N97_014711 [Dioscorea zingiberensis]
MRSFKRRKPLADLTNAPSLSGSSSDAGKPNPVGDHFDFEKSELFNAHVDGREKKKKLCTAVAALAERIKRTRGKSNMQDENVAQQGTISVPRRKSTKKQRQNTARVKDSQETTLPQDFVDKQRAYFAEIDAFELAEEEVSDSELE